MKLIVGNLYKVVIDEYHFDDELMYFTEPYCMYNYCILPGNLYDFNNDEHYMTNYNNVFMYIGNIIFHSTHNEDVYTFHKFLYGAKIIYFKYIAKFIEVKCY